MLLLDTDKYVTPFDILIAYDSGFDIVVPVAQVDAKSVTALTQDAMFPRGVKGVGHTTIFVGGKDVDEAKKILKNVKKSMFPPFEISIIVDPRGGHTTASALVAKIDKVLSEKGFEGLKEKKVVILAGTGQVGQLAATICACEGANVIITSRNRSRAEEIALIYPEVRAFKEAGNTVTSIIGARTKDLLIFEEKISEYSDKFYITTDDGSKGRKGFVSDVLKELMDGEEKIDLVMVVGPVIMMKIIAELTKPYGIKTVASLNPIMVDGTGMCGSCRVVVGGETKFACVDGPEFDAHLVDFDNLMARNRRFLDEERMALEE